MNVYNSTHAVEVVPIVLTPHPNADALSIGPPTIDEVLNRYRPAARGKDPRRRPKRGCRRLRGRLLARMAEAIHVAAMAADEPL